MYALAFGQPQETPKQMKEHLELVKASRDFGERLTAQVIADLGEQLATAKAALKQCEEKSALVEEAKP